MIQIKNLLDNDDVKVTKQLQGFKVLEYQRDLSVTPENAMASYFSSQMNVRKKQLMCDLSKGTVTLQPGAMQMMVGDVKATTGIKGAGDFLKKSFRGIASGESAIKPEYTGQGILVLEPTYKHILLLDMEEWKEGLVIDDGLFMASDSRVTQKITARTNISSALLGNEGLFNLSFQSDSGGIIALESDVPEEEIIRVSLKDDCLKIDGNMAIAWSKSLDFTVERSGKSLIGSAASGEGLVNVFRSTGTVLVSPVGQTFKTLQTMPNTSSFETA